MPPKASMKVKRRKPEGQSRIPAVNQQPHPSQLEVIQDGSILSQAEVIDFDLIAGIVVIQGSFGEPEKIMIDWIKDKNGCTLEDPSVLKGGVINIYKHQNYTEYFLGGNTGSHDYQQAFIEKMAVIEDFDPPNFRAWYWETNESGLLHVKVLKLNDDMARFPMYCFIDSVIEVRFINGSDCPLSAILLQFRPLEKFLHLCVPEVTTDNQKVIKSPEKSIEPVRHNESPKNSPEKSKQPITQSPKNEENTQQIEDDSIYLWKTVASWMINYVQYLIEQHPDLGSITYLTQVIDLLSQIQDPEAEKLVSKLNESIAQLQQFQSQNIGRPSATANDQENEKVKDDSSSQPIPGKEPELNPNDLPAGGLFPSNPSLPAVIVGIPSSIIPQPIKLIQPICNSCSTSTSFTYHTPCCSAKLCKECSLFSLKKCRCKICLEDLHKIDFNQLEKLLCSSCDGCANLFPELWVYCDHKLCLVCLLNIKQKDYCWICDSPYEPIIADMILEGVCVNCDQCKTMTSGLEIWLLQCGCKLCIHCLCLQVDLKKCVGCPKPLTKSDRDQMKSFGFTG